MFIQAVRKMGFLNKPIGWIINLCYKLVPNYAIALLIFAIIMKLLLFPFGIKQQKNMLRQAKLRPKEQAIRKRYAGRDDQVTRQKMQEDLMKLYQDEGYNPASGCLPMILQLFIVFAVYGVMRQPVTYVSDLSKTEVKELGVEIVRLYNLDVLDKEGISDALLKKIDKQAKKVEYGEYGVPIYDKVGNPFTKDDEIEFVRIVRNNYQTLEEFGRVPEGVTYKDLPNFYLFGETFDLSVYPTVALNWYILIPILTFVFTFGSMKLSKKFMYQSDIQQQQSADMGCSMKIMDYVMPLMSTFITFGMPSIIAVYWIYNNVLSFGQQVALKYMYPVPVFTEEDYKRAEIEMNKGVKQYKKKANTGKRAAHRIDLDDDEVAPAPKPEPKKKQDPKASLIAPADMKDETDKKSEKD